MGTTINGIKRGLAWTTIEKCAVQLTQFVLGIIIARHITPEEYGILGVLMVFINISQVFIESGLGSALIYENNLNDNDLQTAFSFNLILSLLFIIILLSFSTQLEFFLRMEGLSIYLSVCLSVLFINVFIVVPTSILQIKMDFRSIAFANISSTLVSGVLGAIAAINQLGIWALIIQLISRSIIHAIAINVQCRWRPLFRFYKDSFLRMYKYSISIFGTSCITKVSSEGISLVIAKILTPYNLGIFSRANQFASIAGTSIGSIFSTVLFPAFSSMRNDVSLFYQLYHKMLVYQAFIIIPIFVFLAVFSEPIIVLLLSETWIDVVPVLKILSIGRLLSTISIMTEQAICASGRSDLEFKQQRDKIILKILMILVCFRWGIIGVACADAISTLMSFFITNHYAKKCLNINTIGQIVQIFPFVIFAFISSIPIVIMFEYMENMILELIWGGILYLVSYIILVMIFKRGLLMDFLRQFKK